MVIKINNPIMGQTKKIFRLEFVYWGWSQWYKWRWNKTHIDLGIWSIYKLPQKGIGKLFWRIISIIIKPMRWYYHKYHVNFSDEKLEESIKDLSYFR